MDAAHDRGLAGGLARRGRRHRGRDATFLDPHTPQLAALRLERRGHVVWLFFNRPDRPDRLNSMSSQMRDELADAWLALDRDREVRVIVSTGEGRASQTGEDVAELSSDGIGMERSPSVHGGVRPSFYRLAPKGEQAGDRGGERDLRRRRLPFCGRRRHRSQQRPVH